MGLGVRCSPSHCACCDRIGVETSSTEYHPVSKGDAGSVNPWLVSGWVQGWFVCLLVPNLCSCVAQLVGCRAPDELLLQQQQQQSGSILV